MLAKKEWRCPRSALRVKQMEKALAGDTTMLIWLVKQYLGQSDNREIAGDVKKSTTVMMIGVKPEKLKGLTQGYVPQLPFEREDGTETQK